MLTLALGLPKGQPPQILCIGAHCDDIEIGCAGTLLMVQRRYPNCKIHWLVLTSVGARRREATASFRRLIRPGCRGEFAVRDLPDGRLPAHFLATKSHLEATRRAISPDLVLTHHGLDRHQDHSLVNQVTWQTFRNHMIWEYEIPKYDGDLATPNLYVPLTRATAERKARTIVHAFPSQSDKSWFTEDNLLAMMRLRGMECRSPSGFAEGYHCRKLLCQFAPASG